MTQILGFAIETESHDLLVEVLGTLGNLTRHGGTTLIELVEENIIRPAFGALQQASAASARRLSAVLVLQELALNNPTLFYLYADQFFTTIWVALKDVGADTRQAAASSLSTSLQLLAGHPPLCHPGRTSALGLVVVC